MTENLGLDLATAVKEIWVDPFYINTCHLLGRGLHNYCFGEYFCWNFHLFVSNALQFPSDFSWTFLILVPPTSTAKYYALPKTFLCSEHFWHIELISVVPSSLVPSSLVSSSLVPSSLVPSSLVPSSQVSSSLVPSSLVPSSLCFTQVHKITPEDSFERVVCKTSNTTHLIQFFISFGYSHKFSCLLIHSQIALHEYKTTDRVFLKLFPGNFGVVWSGRMQREFKIELTVAVKKMKGKVSTGHFFEFCVCYLRSKYHIWLFLADYKLIWKVDNVWTANLKLQAKFQKVPGE